MVKRGNHRVMITCTDKQIDQMEKLCSMYDMTFTQLLKMLVAKEASERKID